jgi:hypothetical protein
MSKILDIEYLPSPSSMSTTLQVVPAADIPLTFHIADSPSNEQMLDLYLLQAPCVGRGGGGERRRRRRRRWCTRGGVEEEERGRGRLTPGVGGRHKQATRITSRSGFSARMTIDNVIPHSTAPHTIILNKHGRASSFSSFSQPHLSLSVLQVTSNISRSLACALSLSRARALSCLFATVFTDCSSLKHVPLPLFYYRQALSERKKKMSPQSRLAFPSIRQPPHPSTTLAVAVRHIFTTATTLSSALTLFLTTHNVSSHSKPPSLIPPPRALPLFQYQNQVNRASP